MFTARNGAQRVPQRPLTADQDTDASGKECRSRRRRHSVTAECFSGSFSAPAEPAPLKTSRCPHRAFARPSPPRGPSLSPFSDRGGPCDFGLSECPPRWRSEAVPRAGLLPVLRGCTGFASGARCRRYGHPAHRPPGSFRFPDSCHHPLEPATLRAADWLPPAKHEHRPRKRICQSLVGAAAFLAKKSRDRVHVKNLYVKLRVRTEST